MGSLGILTIHNSFQSFRYIAGNRLRNRAILRDLPDFGCISLICSYNVGSSTHRVIRGRYSSVNRQGVPQPPLAGLLGGPQTKPALVLGRAKEVTSGAVGQDPGLRGMWL